MTCFSRVFIRRSRPSAVALVSNENHQASCQGRIQMKTRKTAARFVKSRRRHKMIRCQAEIPRHVKPAALAILIYIRGYIYPAASMAMYSTQSAQDRLPPDSTPALWFLTQRSSCLAASWELPYRVHERWNTILQNCMCAGFFALKEPNCSVQNFNAHVHLDGLMLISWQ